MNAIEARQARAAAALASRVVDHWRTSSGYTATARRFGVTSAFVRLCVENAGVIRVAEPEPTRDLADDPIDAVEVEGWASLLSAGWLIADVAADAGVDASLVRSLLGAKAERSARGEEVQAGPKPRRDPRVALLFPTNQLTPSSPCPHDGPIRKGDRVVCMVCHASGLDGIDLPHLGTVPPPSDSTGDDADHEGERPGERPTPPPAAPLKKDPLETRRERRARQRAEQAARTASGAIG